MKVSGSAEGGQPSAGVWGVPKSSLFKRIWYQLVPLGRVSELLSDPYGCQVSMVDLLLSMAKAADEWRQQGARASPTWGG